MLIGLPGGVLDQGVLSQLRDGVFRRTRDDPYLPGLKIAPRGRPSGGIEDLADRRLAHRRIEKVSDRNACLQRVVDVHAQTLICGVDGCKPPGSPATAAILRQMLTFTLDEQVAVLNLDDGKANAITSQFCVALIEALDRAEREAKAVALIGRPGRFCAGFDLNEFKRGPEATEALLNHGAKMLTRLFRHPQPVVVGCSGHAVAGGALILLTGDTRIGVEGDFKIGLNETAINMVLPFFGIELAQFRLTQAHLHAAYVQAQLYDPKGAQTAGFLDATVPADDLIEAVKARRRPWRRCRVKAMRATSTPFVGTSSRDCRPVSKIEANAIKT